MTPSPMKMTPLLAVLALAANTLMAQTESQTPNEADEPKVITIDLEARTIDLAAKMVPAEPQWLELIATTPGPKGREHEAIVTIDALPSHIHLALIQLGLEPGQPQKNRREEDRIITDPPTGPALELSFVYENNGQSLEVPVHEWVVDAETEEPLPSSTWLFTGSVFKKWKGREYYMADEAGTIASLVNFGDDLIVRQTDKTQDTDFQQLQINKEKIPPYGSGLTLRIRVPEMAPQTPPAEQKISDSDPSDGKSSDKPAPDEP